MKLSCLLCGLLLTTAVALAGDGAVLYTVENVEYEGFYVTPGGEAPLVLLVHDWDGITDYERKRAAMLNEQGYAVFAVDMFGKGVRPSKLEEKRKLTGALYADRPRMGKLLRAGMAAAKGQGAHLENAVAMGYCFGGTCVLEMAMAGETLKGFVAFHGGLEVPEGRNYSATQGSVLIFHGTADKHVTIDHFASLAKALEQQKVPHEMIAYGGAPHAFSVFGSDRYRKQADQDSWARFLQYLAATCPRATSSVTLKGAPLKTVGTRLAVGARVPDFRVLNQNFQPVQLSSFQGRPVLISAVPSLDTPVCSLQTKRFNDELAKLPENVAILTISMDLPTAQKRFCTQEKIEQLLVLSDAAHREFGQRFGILIEKRGLLARSVFVVGKDGRLQYSEIVPEVTAHPNYDAALAAARRAAK